MRGVVHKQLELEQETRYARLIGGKVSYITEAEAQAEEVLATTGDNLGKENQLVSKANRLRESIGFIHQAMRDDEQRPSEFEADYGILWYQYWGVIYQLRLINPEFVAKFEDKVVAKVRELETRLSAICDNWNPDDSDNFEKMLALYEMTTDQAIVLRWNLDLSYLFTLDARGTILALWRQKGKPAIPLSQGLKCANLEKFLKVATDQEYASIVEWARSVTQTSTQKGKRD